ncbi:hypothetical protein FRC00_003742 [Tulasnella sp. 408]|nr:hypothetical protein FRC00_003742 [Tulasnella sp. 408]
MSGCENIVFRGRDGQECEDFIRAIHKAAYAAGKLRDDAWMADVAVTCLSGRALRSYLTLEPEVKRDWSLLSLALLERYPPPDDDEEMQVEGSSIRQVLTPAGPQVPQLNARIGRIKVIGANSADFGYLGDGKTVYADGIGAGASATEAILISYVPANGLYEIEIQRSGGKAEVLGVHWADPSVSTAFGSENFAILTALNYEGLYRSSKLGRPGPGYTRMWNVLADNTLRPYLEEHGSLNPLQFFLYKPSQYQRLAVDVAADASAFAIKYRDTWALVSPEERSAGEA